MNLVIEYVNIWYGFYSNIRCSKISGDKKKRRKTGVISHYTILRDIYCTFIPRLQHISVINETLSNNWTNTDNVIPMRQAVRLFFQFTEFPVSLTDGSDATELIKTRDVNQKEIFLLVRSTICISKLVIDSDSRSLSIISNTRSNMRSRIIIQRSVARWLKITCKWGRF